MKKTEKIIIIVIVTVILLVVVLFLAKKQKSPFSMEENNSSATLNQELQDRDFLGDGFSVKIPKGWKEQVAPTGVSLMTVDVTSLVNDQRAKQINFHPYYTVVLDSLVNTTREEYIANIKRDIALVAPGIVFSNENDLEINANEAWAMEGDVTQNEIEFKFLMVFIKGGDNDLWVLSFNTTKADWDRDSDVFTEIAQSFLVR